MDSPSGRKLSRAVVFVQRAPLRTVLKEELHQFGFQDVVLANDLAECTRQLTLDNEGLFVIDWEWGYDTVCKVLRQAARPMNMEPRPIYLLASQSSPQIVAVGMEYRAFRVHIGDISKDKVQAHIRDIVNLFMGADELSASFQQVFALRGQGKWEQAEKVLLRLMKDYPNNERVIVELTINYIQLNRWQDALKTIEGLAVLESFNLRAKGLYARCLMKFNYFDRAIRVLEQAKLINPLFVERLIDLGHCFFYVDRIRDAYDNFRTALEIDPFAVEATKGLAACKLVEGDINEGLDMLRPVTTPEELASVFNNAAILCMRQSRFDQGFRLYENALAAIGGDRKKTAARLLFNMGLGYYRWQKYEKAKEYFLKAAKLDPTFGKATHNSKAIELFVVDLPFETKKASKPKVELLVPDEEELPMIEDFEDEAI